MPQEFDDSALFSSDYKAPDTFDDSVIFSTDYQAPALPEPMGRAESNFNSFVKGFGNVAASLPKAIGETAVSIANTFGDDPIWGNPEGIVPEETTAYIIGQSVSDYVDKNFPTSDEYEGEFLTDFFTGMGSVGGYLTGGAATALAKAPAFVGTALMGSSSIGVEQVEDYKRSMKEQGLELDPATRSKAHLLGSGLGLSEAVPIYNALNKIDKISGGGVKKIIKEGFKGGVEELIQEVGQSIGGNAIASDVLEYDKERDIFTGTVRSGEVGFSLGFLLNTLTSAVGGRRGARPGGKKVEDVASDITQNVEVIDRSEFDDVADYNQTIIDGIYEPATELTGGKPISDPSKYAPEIGSRAVDVKRQREIDAELPKMGIERTGVLIPADQPVSIEQRINQLFDEAVKGGGIENINQQVLDGLYGKTEGIVDHGEQYAPAPLTDSEVKQAEIDRREAALGRELNPDEMTELAAQFQDVPREAASIVPPMDPAGFDRENIESQLKDLYSESKRLEAESKGQTVPNYVAASGGIDWDESVSQGFDPVDMKASNKKGMPFGRQLFTRGGKSFDEIGELLAEAGVQSVMEDGLYSSNAALDLIQTFVTSGEPVYMPGDEQQVFDAESDLRTKTGLIEQYEGRLSEIDEYERIKSTQGVEAADEYFYEARSLDLYQEMVDTGEIASDEILFEGQPVTVDTRFSEQDESLAALLDKAVAVNPELAEKEFERLVDAGDAEIIQAMNSIIRGEVDERAEKQPEKRGEEPGDIGKVQAPEAEKDRRQKSEQVKADKREAERRTDKAERKRVSEMTDAEKDVALLTNEKTGLRNERAYGEDKRLAHQAFFDIDNFKQINDEYTYDGADIVLAAFGGIMAANSSKNVIPYHLHGDEFIVQSDSFLALKAFSVEVQNQLKNKKIKVDLPGKETKTATNIGASFGIGKTKELAESELKKDKAERAKVGVRTERKPELSAFPGTTPAEHIAEEADKAAASPENDKQAPTKEQIEAESYAKGHPVIQGLDVAIENPAGSKRKPQWPVMAAHYGDIVGYIGADGDAIDVFVKPDVDIPADNPVYIINQYVKGSFDEHKNMMGFADEAGARKAYNDSFTKGWDGLNSIHELTIEEFKKWLESGNTKVEYGKPVKKYPKAPEKPKEKKPVTQAVAEKPAKKKEPAKHVNISADNYSILNGKKISYDVEIEDTGEIVTYTEDSGEAMRTIDNRINKLKTLRDCIG